MGEPGSVLSPGLHQILNAPCWPLHLRDEQQQSSSSLRLRCGTASPAPASSPTPSAMTPTLGSGTDAGAADSMLGSGTGASSSHSSSNKPFWRAVSMMARHALQFVLDECFYFCTFVHTSIYIYNIYIYIYPPTLSVAERVGHPPYTLHQCQFIHTVMQ